MNRTCLLLLLIGHCAAFAADTAPPTATPAPPPSAPAQRSAADLKKLVAPIALYPDPLIATLLPASVYPLEIVQAARFVADTNNLAKLDAQPWDESVKAVARVPAAIKMMNDDLNWTMELGEAFLAQDKGVMDAIQAMRLKAQQAGTLQTTPQQVVVVTNMVTQTTVEQKVVVVTNTVVEIQPSNPQVVYVPTYNPYTVYYPPPAYVANPYPLLTFGAGVAVGAIIANNCDWRYGGCYHGHGNVNFYGDVNINRGNINTGNINTGNINSGNRGSQQKWQPDQNRVRTSGTPTAAASARNTEARGWSSSNARPSTQPGAATRPQPSTGGVGSRPAQQPAAGTRPATTPGGTRPTTSGGMTQPKGQQPSVRQPSVQQPSVNRSASSPAASTRPAASPSPSRSSAQTSSAFSGVNSGARANTYSSRGASSRSFSGGGRSGGGGRR